MGFALLKVRPLAPANKVERPAGDSVFVVMPKLSQQSRPVSDNASPPKLV
jgi:hypothetical protein